MTKKIYVTLSGGLGNQLHTLAAAYYVAKLKNRKIVLLMPKDPKSAPFRRDEKDITSFGIHELPLGIVATLGPNDGLRKKLIRHIFRGYSSASKKLFPHTHLRIEGLETDTYSSKIRSQEPRFMQDHYENAFFPIAAREFGFPPRFNLISKSQDFANLEQSLSIPNRRSIIGVHIRLGDFRIWNNGTFMLDSQYYLENLRSIVSRFPNSQVWVFSDEPDEAVEMLGSEFELLVVSKKFNLTNAEELVLLSRVDAILASRSTFSWWACYWKEVQSNIWYPDLNLCLDGWIFSSRKVEKS
jgi:hypothetical protein